MPDSSTVSINTAELSRLAATLLAEIETQMRAESEHVSAAKQNAQTIVEAASKLAASHSGSNFGYHGALYYRDFQVPPSRFSVEWGGVHGLPIGWLKKGPEEVKTRIESLAGLVISDVEVSIQAPLESAKRLHRDITIRLTPLHQLPDGNREKQLLEQLEKLDWNDSAHNKCVQAAINGYPNVTRDSNAIYQGRMLTSHDYYEAVGIQITRSCEAIEEFWSLTSRLLRQFQIVSSSNLILRPARADDDSDLPARYERLKTGTLLLAALACSLVIAVAVAAALRRWPWPWLLSNPNSYAIEWLSYAVLLLFTIGLLVRKFRNYCWGIALIPLIAAALQSLGGPTHTP